MVQETRIDVPIGVLSDNVQELQQKIDEHATIVRVIGTRLERMDTSFANLQTFLEERMPLRQPEPTQPPALAVQGEQTPINQPRKPILEEKPS
jgi:hypothetical protein